MSLRDAVRHFTSELHEADDSEYSADTLEALLDLCVDIEVAVVGEESARRSRARRAQMLQDQIEQDKANLTNKVRIRGVPANQIQSPSDIVARVSDVG